MNRASSGSVPSPSELLQSNIPSISTLAAVIFSFLPRTAIALAVATLSITHPLLLPPPTLEQLSLLNMATGPPSPENNTLIQSPSPVSLPPNRLSALLVNTAQASNLQTSQQTASWEWDSRALACTMPLQSSR